jgi:metal-responsive CopG/Arc/MetJ family transcriptional regulator
VVVVVVGEAFKIIITFKVNHFLLEQMDIAAQKLRITRSELIRRAIVYYLAAVEMDKILKEAISGAP